MIDRCFNPVCNRELLHLRDGRVVRVIRGMGEEASMEHYWLCGPCHETLDFDFPEDGSVALKSRLDSELKSQYDYRDVVLPERRHLKR